jgi:hypothetical protein
MIFKAQLPADKCNWTTKLIQDNKGCLRISTEVELSTDCDVPFGWNVRGKAG